MRHVAQPRGSPREHVKGRPKHSKNCGEAVEARLDDDERHKSFLSDRAEAERLSVFAAKKYRL